MGFKPCFFFLILCILSFRGQCQGEWQNWNEFEIVCRLSNRFNLYENSEFKFFGNFSYLGGYNVNPGIDFQFDDHFKLFFNYKYEFEKECETGTFIHESQYEFVPVFSYKLNNTKLKLMTKFDLKQSDGNTIYQWRELVKVKQIVKIKQTEIKPFIEEEIFSNDKHGFFFQNRFSIGIEKEFNKHFEADIHLLLIEFKNENIWYHTNVIGLFLSYHIN